MTRPSALESLPQEIILEILSFLETKDIIHLQRCSRRLLKLSRDNVFWRTRCLLTSSFLEGINLRRGLRFPDGFDGTLNDAAALQVHNSSDAQRSPPLDFPWASNKARKKEIQKITANWDPSFPDENINWYDEYIHRNSPISASWFERPQLRDGGLKDTIEVKGVAIYQHGEEEVFAVSPLDDGSVCLWDVKGTRRDKKGSILQRSKAGLLRMGSSKSPYLSPDCVSVDSPRGRAFFAVQGHVVEIDLETLQVVGDQPFEWTITTMSSAQPGVPLTIGTIHGIHLHDYRYGRYVEQTRQERIDDFDRYAPRQLSLLLSSDPLPPYAPLPPTNPPLSILHLEQPGNKQAVSDDIFVAGSFSNILNYDRRMFPKIKGSIHSGARLCSLTSLPYPFSSVDSELRRRGELSIEQVEKIKETAGGRTLVACGEYNTKGSLEMYGLGPSLSGKESYGVNLNSVMKNRHTASQSKLLSVINHGTCLVVSDGQGYLKWIERDGFTEVRRHYIGPAERIVDRSLFDSMPGSGEIARKLISTQSRQAGNDKSNDDDILLWTGEKLGLVNFSSKQGFMADDFEVGDTRTPEEVALEKERQRYGQRMRQALEHDANGVRLVKFLGAGIRG